MRILIRVPMQSHIEGHDVENVPARWSPDSPRLAALDAYSRPRADELHSRIFNRYNSVVLPALQYIPEALSEGLSCAANAAARCSAAELAEIYSFDRVLTMMLVMRARDWMLDMYGDSRFFMAPIIDLCNFGQMGVRVDFNNKRHAFTVKAYQRIQAGEEVLFYYGSFCRQDMINMYGFSVDKAKDCTRRSKRRQKSSD